MANLPQSGISLVAQNAGQFFNTLGRANAATTQFTQTTTKSAAQASAAYARLEQSAQSSVGKIAGLNEKLSLQQRAFALLQVEVAKTAARYGDASVQAQKKQLALDRLGAAIKTTERSLDAEKAALAQTESEMRQAATATNKLEQETEQTGRSFLSLSSMAGRAMDGITGAVRGGLSPIRSALKSIGDAFDQIVIGALRRVGEMMVNVLADAARAVGSWLKDSIGVAGDFEQTLNVLGATSGATAADLDLVARKAKDLGADMSLPATSAQDAAEVMLELSKAGFTVQESMDAAKGALQLSAAAQVDAATAASITAGAINAFGLEASDAVRVADLLAAGANASSASMTDLSAGLQQAGFAFNAAGLPIEDLITSLAALTNVGLTGSDSGTALKNALMRLMDPTDKAAKLMAELGFSAYGANGQMKPLPTLIADLNKSLAGMTDEERNAALGNIFLSDGMKAMIPLLDLGEDGFLKLKGAVQEQGAAATVANAQMQGWNGGIQAIGSQMETLQLVIGTLLKDALTPFLFRIAEFIPKVTAFVERMAALGQEVGKSSQPFKFLMTALALLNPSLIGVVGLMLRLYDAVAPIVESFQKTGGSVSGLITALSTLLTPLGATEGAIATATQAVIQIWDAVNRVIAILSGEFTGATAGAQGALAGIINFVLGTALPAIATLATWFANNLPAAIEIAKAIFADIGAFIGSLMPTIQSIVTTALAVIQTFWQKHGADVLFIVTSLWEGIKGVVQIVLGAIQGILAVILGAMEGDVTKHLDTIKAANETIWNGIRNFLSGILNAIAGIFGTTLSGLIETWRGNFINMGRLTNYYLEQVKLSVGTKINEVRAKVTEVIGQIVSFWDQNFGHLFGTVDQIMAAAASIISTKIGEIKNSFSSITGVIGDVISAVGDLIASFSDIHVPDILTPGSPTPFELGLRGINKAAGQLATTLNRQFAPALGGLPAMPTMGGATTNTTTNYGPSISMPVYTNQSPAVLSQGLALIGASL